MPNTTPQYNYGDKNILWMLGLDQILNKEEQVAYLMKIIEIIFMNAFVDATKRDNYIPDNEVDSILEEINDNPELGMKNLNDKYPFFQNYIIANTEVIKIKFLKDQLEDFKSFLLNDEISNAAQQYIIDFLHLLIDKLNSMTKIVDSEFNRLREYQKLFNYYKKLF